MRAGLLDIGKHEGSKEREMVLKERENVHISTQSEEKGFKIQILMLETI